MTKLSLMIATALNTVAALFGPPSVDDVIADLKTTVEALDKAVEAQLDRHRSERDTANVYALRSNAAYSEAERAARVRDRLNTLLS